MKYYTSYPVAICLVRLIWTVVGIVAPSKWDWQEIGCSQPPLEDVNAEAIVTGEFRRTAGAESEREDLLENLWKLGNLLDDLFLSAACHISLHLPIMCTWCRLKHLFSPGMKNHSPITKVGMAAWDTARSWGSLATVKFHWDRIGSKIILEWRCPECDGRSILESHIYIDSVRNHTCVCYHPCLLVIEDGKRGVKTGPKKIRKINQRRTFSWLALCKGPSAASTSIFGWNLVSSRQCRVGCKVKVTNVCEMAFLLFWSVLCLLAASCCPACIRIIPQFGRHTERRLAKLFRVFGLLGAPHTKQRELWPTAIMCQAELTRRRVYIFPTDIGKPEWNWASSTVTLDCRVSLPALMELLIIFKVWEVF